MDNNKSFWQRAAKAYSFLSKHHRKYKENFKALTEPLFPYLNKSMNALEIGCATGQLSHLIIDKVNHLTATDFSENMIEICKKENRSKIEFRLEDGSNLSFEDESFDAVIVSNVLHIVPNPDDIISEAKRVLKPEGIIFAPIFVHDTKFNLLVSKLFGFKVYQNRNEKEYLDFLEKSNLEVIFSKRIKGHPLDEFIVICKKREAL